MPQDVSQSLHGYGGWLVFLSIAIVESALMIKFLFEPGISSAILPAIVIIAGLLILSPRVFEIVSLSLEKSKMSVELGKIQKTFEKTQQNITTIENKINTLFIMTMSAAMYENLRKLASRRFGPYSMTDMLRRELYHLRTIGYIDVKSIRDIPQYGDDLSAYIKVTPAGMEFVELRETLTANRNCPNVT